MQLAQTLFNPESWLNARAAERAVEASAAEVSTTSEIAAEETAVRYVSALRAQATLNARLRERELAGELLVIAEQELKAGVATRLDLVRARTQVASASSGIELAQARLTQARIDLARSLGYRAGAEIALSDTLHVGLAHSAAPETNDAARTMALSHRPEIEAARLRLAESRLAARAISAERFGALQFVGNYGLNGTSPLDDLGTGQVALRYSIPLFDGFRSEGRRREQEARASEAEVQLTELSADIEGQVESALAAVHAGEARESNAREQVELAEEEVRDARLLFANGVTGNSQLINAQVDLVNANTATIEAQAETAEARIRLARAVGVTQSLR